MSGSRESSMDWRPVAWFAERWQMHRYVAAQKLRELHALHGVPRWGNGSGLRYHVESVQQALLEQED
jgi:hypothetical protein